jgi:hypothetical protein
MEGTSFLPILESGLAHGRDAWFYEYFTDYPYRVPPQQAVRTNTHKYIEFEGSQKPELYDLIADPKEHTNLFGTDEAKEMTAHLRGLIDEFRAKYGLKKA